MRNGFRLFQPVLAFAVVLLSGPVRGGDEAATPAYRRPVAMLLSPDECWLYTGNQETGTLSVVDLKQGKAVVEHPIGRRLSDALWLTDNTMLITDEQAHELLVVHVEGAVVAVRRRIAVSAYPVSVAVTQDKSRCTVASLWSRRLSVVSLDERVADPILRTIDLPMAPRKQLFVADDTRLIVADSFQGRLAVIDPASGEILHLKRFPGHNVRGLGVSPNGKMLLIAHQMLNELAHTVRNDVHWGLLMSNDLRWLKLSNVLGKTVDERDLYEGAHMHPLGEAGNATGDPAGLDVARDGTVVVTLGGVGEVAIGRESDFSLSRLPVGKRPTAVKITRNSKQAYVANTFDDSISVLNLVPEERETVRTIALGPRRKLTLAEQGEQLFFDATLSHDAWMSCHSCHTDGHTNGMLNDNFSDGSFGAPKRVLTLLGKAGTSPFAWNAGVKALEDQIQNSIRKTMQSDQAPKPQHIKAIAAFVRSLAPPPSVDKARGTDDPTRIGRGRRLFAKSGCTNCHAEPKFTTPATYDVGLADSQGNKRFNPPSLLGVGQRGPYFHDNSVMELSDVLIRSKHQLDRDLSADEAADLLAFLRSL